jgi:hypothetical protein
VIEESEKIIYEGKLRGREVERGEETKNGIQGDLI